jgi:EAL domain-containing protein (putative c-di-GMP-specific phosphodiesterase class I)/ActR/RegA family two-component response regulator
VSGPASPPGKVLILDDDEAVGAYISSCAEAAGFATRTVMDASEFLSYAVEWEPTHIVLDLIMPHTDGVEIVHELARRGCGARIILMSGADRRVLDAARRSSVEQGLVVIGVLSKPFRPDSLLSLLDNGLYSGLADHHGQQAMLSPAAQSPPAQMTYAELYEAIEQKQLFLVYQPKIRCSDNGLAGVEALVRWQHPTRGLIPPSGFVPFAEQCGLIDAMTALVVDLALEYQSKHGDAGDRHIAINLSAKSLADRSLPDRLLGRCRHYHVNPQNVVLEVTETAAMADPAATVSLATRLRLKGFQLSIDDFGVGYSSFAQLARLPFSELKVDASFVKEVRRSSESRKIVAAMVGLGHSLGMTVTAEGVGDSEALSFLRNSGSDFAQGYFIGHPLPEEAPTFQQAANQERQAIL